ncbi:MAG: primosomal protein N', partial [Deltaproteobacteria bacterium]|nr:primosomal protein N' [Deltaproteobacteria bacterium]
GGRELTGIIVELQPDDGSAPKRDYRLKALRDVLDSEPVLSQAMLALLEKAAREVLCPIGIALTSALPAGSSPKRKPGFELTERGRQALAQRVARGPASSLLKLLSEGPQSTRKLERALPDGRKVLQQCSRDSLIRQTFIEQGPTAVEATVRTAEVASGIDLKAALQGDLKRSPKQAALLEHLAQYGPMRVSQLTETFPTASALLRSLRERGLVQMGSETLARDILGEALEEHSQAPDLTDDQNQALKPMCEAIAERAHRTFLLHGITGSGKTEVYLSAVGEALRQGRQALVLVPEIPLTHQILSRLRSRFGDNLAVLHSGLSQSERLEQWKKLRHGDTPIAVGARSALFAPLENLGVIILDEEHDGAYKSEEGFRYHARNFAALRGEAAGCPVILGSATPALETRQAADAGEIERIVLSRRIGGRPLPEVEIVDLVAERKGQGERSRLILSHPLRQSMAHTLKEGDQTLLFLNRRGFSTKVLCHACGHAEHCKHCDIALVFHAHDQLLRCHYCDYTLEPSKVCSNCGTEENTLQGLGTQRLEEEVRSLFPEARVARLDRDVSQRKGATQEILHALHDREIDILIGTQMIAKGHDFPGVRTVGIVAADLGLHMPDFRASERTFQLLTQVAGRAGRGDTPGRVILQTFSPRHYAIDPVRTHDYETFYAEEIEHRRDLGYPPFGGLVHLLLAGPEAQETEDQIEAMASALRKSLPAEASLEILGPAPCPLARLRGQYRFQLLVKGSDPQALHKAARVLLETGRKLPATFRFKVDLNPVNML